MVVENVIGLPGASDFPDSAIKLYSNNLYIVPSEFTPLIASISALVILGLYAIIDYVNEDVPRYENIEVCAYRKIIEDSEATIMEE